MIRKLFVILILFAGGILVAGFCWGIKMAEIEINMPKQPLYYIQYGEEVTESKMDYLVSQFFAELPEPQRCPFCGGEVVPCYFGKHDLLLYDYDSLGRQRRVCVGCIGDDSLWMCLKCNHRYSLKLSTMIVALCRYPYLFKRKLDSLPSADSLARIPNIFIYRLGEERAWEIHKMIREGDK